MDVFRKDRRSLNRYRCLVSARLIIPGRPSIGCAIRDLTPEGAKVVLNAVDPQIIPKKVFILLPGLGELWAAKVCWRDVDTLGVAFITGEADKSETPRNPDIFALRVQVADLAHAQGIANADLPATARRRRRCAP